MKKLFQTLLIFTLGIVFATDLNGQIVNFPDPNFKAAILALTTPVDLNGDGEIQESEAAIYTGVIDVSNKGISDLTGIEAFFSIKILRASSNQLQQVDLSKNTALESLAMISNSLTSLDVRNNPALIALVLPNNQLTSIDLSNNQVLEVLNVSVNQLSAVALDNNPRLTHVTLYQNQLNSIDVSNQLRLNSLSLFGNNLSELDVSRNTLLESLQISNNPITGNLDLSSHSNLNFLQVNETDISGLNIANGNNTAMTSQSFNALRTNNLTCIQVDDVSYAVANFDQVDTNTSFSLNCSPDPGIDRSSYNCVGYYTVSASALSADALSGGERIFTSDFSTGSVLLYRTASARYGKLIVTGFTGSNNQVISFDFQTYNTDGSTYASGSLIGSGSFDLDKGTPLPDFFETDVTWSNSLLSPRGRTQLAVYDDLLFIPDSNFEKALINHNPVIDTNGDRKIQTCEAKAYDGILNLKDKSIRDLTGLGAFSNATGLLAADNMIEDLPVRWNEKLIMIDASNNRLSAIDVDHNLNLTSLDCNYNQLTKIDVSNNLDLQSLQCSNNNLSDVNLKRNINLYVINLVGNRLTALNLSENIKLRKLYLKSNELSTLDVSSNPDLYYLSVEENKLTAIDFRANLQLETLYISDNALTILNLEKNSNLKWLKAAANDLAQISFFKGAPLRIIDLNGNKLNELHLKEMTLLEQLTASKNQIAQLSFDESVILKQLDVSSNKIIGNLDLSNYNRLRNVLVNNNQFSGLNIANGANHFMRNPSDFNALDNPNLFCIQVDDVSYADRIFTKKDNIASYDTDCGFSREVYSGDAELETIDSDKLISVFPNPATTTLHINSDDSGNTLTLYDSHGREVLRRNLNSVQSIDLTGISNGMLILKVVSPSGKTLLSRKIIKRD